MPIPPLIGHNRIQSILARQIENGRSAHAYLFVGPEGVGKTRVAMELLDGGRREGGKAERPAGDEVLFVSRLADEKTGKLKAAISVEQIRELRERLALTSFAGERKSVFVEEADRLNGAAANALLKTLEEPRGDTLVILRAETVESVPETIASRCQILRFSLVPEAAIASGLVSRGVSREEAAELAAASRGRPGVALRLLTDRAFRAERDTAVGVFGAILAAPLPRRLALVADLLPKTEADKPTALEKILDAWEETARQKLLGGDKRFVAVLDRLREAREGMDRNVNPLLALEHVVVAREI